MAHLSVDGKNKVSCTAAVHRHMGLFHTTALQAYLKKGSRTTDHGSNHHHIGSYLQLFSLVEEGCLMETLASLFPYCSHIRTQCLDEMQGINLASSFLFAVGTPTWITKVWGCPMSQLVLSQQLPRDKPTDFAQVLIRCCQSFLCSALVLYH